MPKFSSNQSSGEKTGKSPPPDTLDLPEEGEDELGGDRPTSGRPKSSSVKGNGSSANLPKKSKMTKAEKKRQKALQARNDAIQDHTSEDMEKFLQQAKDLLDNAVKRAMNPKKKGWELHFEASVLGELAEIAQHASRAAAAAAMTAAAASVATAAALRGAIEIEPLLEAYSAPAFRKQRTPESADDTAQWGYTKARGSQIIKPLGFLVADDPHNRSKSAKGKEKGAAGMTKNKTAHRKLRDDELPAVLKQQTGAIAGRFDSTSYAAKKAARIEAAKARRGSNLAVALPPLPKKGKAKKQKSKANKDKAGGSSDEAGSFSVGLIAEESWEEEED